MTDEEVKELLEDVAFQFAYRCNNKERKWLTTGGLSTLEAVFAALGWDDPHYIEESGCDHPGCTAWATCGTSVGDSYKWFCSEHWIEVSREKGFVKAKVPPQPVERQPFNISNED